VIVTIEVHIIIFTGVFAVGSYMFTPRNAEEGQTVDSDRQCIQEARATLQLGMAIALVALNVHY